MCRGGCDSRGMEFESHGVLSQVLAGSAGRNDLLGNAVGPACNRKPQVCHSICRPSFCPTCEHLGLLRLMEVWKCVWCGRMLREVDEGFLWLQDWGARWLEVRVPVVSVSRQFGTRS